VNDTFPEGSTGEFTLKNQNTTVLVKCRW